MHDDAIEIEECKITIRSGYNTSGEPVFATAFEGDIEYVHAIGLLEITKEAIKDVYEAGGMEG